ncbi:MAG: FKBP-type peptidyl-prolyl cis-trans isomerase [Candidatus Binatia bacterium]
MRHLALLALGLVLATARLAPAAGPELKTDDDKTLYALGLLMSRNLGAFSLSESELAFVQAGIADGTLGHEKKVDAEQLMPKVQELAKTRQAKKGAEFLAKAAAEKGAKKTDSGLVYQEIKAGTGEAPKATDKVKVHYTGTLTDGTVFDSSVQRGQPAEFPLNGVIKCWTEGVQLMKVGGKAKLVCPSDIAYGDRGAGGKIPPGSTLVFEVELLEIVQAEAPKAEAPKAEAPK